MITPKVMSGLLLLLLVLILMLLWKTIGQNKPLNWSDLIADRDKNGEAFASPKKFGILVGTAIGSWAVIASTYDGDLNPTVFGLYLGYCGGVEGWSAYMKMKSDQTVGGRS